MMPVKYGSGCSSAPPAGFPLSAKVRQAFKHTTRTPSQGRQSMKRGGSRIADQAACPTSPIPHSKSSLYFLRITGLSQGARYRTAGPKSVYRESSRPYTVPNERHGICNQYHTGISADPSISSVPAWPRLQIPDNRETLKTQSYGHENSNRKCGNIQRERPRNRQRQHPD